MALRTDGPVFGPLSQFADDESDGNECYFSLQEQDVDSDTSECYYSVEDGQDEYQVDLPAKGNGLAGEERSREHILGKYNDLRLGDKPDLDYENHRTTEEAEICEFFSNGERLIELKSGSVAVKEPAETRRQVLKSTKLWSPTVVIDSSEVPEEIISKEPTSSPSLLLVNALGCSKSAEIESITDDIEVIELNDYEELDRSANVQDDIEVIDSDGSFMREEPFVEFDGSKKIITVDSDCEAEDRKLVVDETTDWSRKRDRSPDPYEPMAEKHQHSPVQRKMKKLMELAQKAENESDRLR